MWSCSEEVEDALWVAAEEVVGGESVAPRRLRTAIEERSRLYTSDRESIDQPSDERADLAARALFYTVADAPKSSVALSELRSRELLPRHVRVLDVGAGCGAMTLGALPFFESLDVVAVDRDEGALRIFEEVARALGVRLETRVADAYAENEAGPFDLILLGSVLNELDKPLPLVRSLLGRLAQGGSIVIVEPALRSQSRRLHQLRDSILRAGTAHVFAPCVRRESRCPALDDERDWCHEDRPTALPPRAQRLSRETSLRRWGLKFSYLVLRHDDESLVSEVPAARVVSRVRKLKGKWEGFLCSEDGRQKTSLLKRDLGADNRAFTALERGDVVTGIKGARLAAETVVSRHRPAGDGD